MFKSLAAINHLKFLNILINFFTKYICLNNTPSYEKSFHFFIVIIFFSQEYLLPLLHFLRKVFVELLIY